ncbi:MAG: hypothetical protein ABSC57_05745 [Syntrophales bacterium]
MLVFRDTADADNAEVRIRLKGERLADHMNGPYIEPTGEVRGEMVGHC